MPHPDHPGHPSRRLALHRLGAAPLAFGLGGGLLPGLGHAATSAAPGNDGRILVVMELSGANDGLNTVVPHGDDAYYRLRPRLAIPKGRVRRLDDHWGLNPGLSGLERLYKEGQLAIVHGLGYEQPSFSHFSSMAYWHTAAPNRGDEYGWLGRLADQLQPQARPGFIVDIEATQSLAVRSARHTPLVFDQPERFNRNGYSGERELLDQLVDASPSPSPSASSTAAAQADAALQGNRAWLADVARSARDSSSQVREAWARYRTPVDYGIYGVHLDKVAAMIAAGLPARVYHVAYGNNAFDTHVQQADQHQRLLTYVSDAISAFQRDLQRIGRAQDVLLLVYSEFGRRAGENANQGSDHGTANVGFLVGPGVKGGHHGTPPDLARLAPDGNLVHTADFRRFYATALQGWMGRMDDAALSQAVLKGRFEPFGALAGA
ncbi:MAG: hypothetical protein RL722_783 [Pseudomonadota bacterium]|jgi:uncharacterized protein (DUF1501 family)